MHILQNPVRGPVHGHPEIPKEAGIPGLFQIGRIQLAGDQVAFQIEAHHDVQVILHLVGFGADIARCHAVHAGIEVVGIVDVQPVERVRHAVEQPAGEGAAAADLVLGNPRLRFVHAKRDAAAKRGEGIVAVDAELVIRMADLVDGGIKAVEGFRRDHSGGDPAVLPAARTERMHGQIHAPARPVVTEGGGALPGQAQLRLGRELAAQQRGLVVGPHDIVAQLHETRAQIGEDRPDRGRRGAGFVIVQQRVIGVAPIGDGGGFLALEHQDLGQRRQEGRDILIGAGLGPDPLRQRGGARQFRRQPRRNAGLAAIIAPDQFQHPGVFGILDLGLGPVQPFADARIGAALVQHGLHGGHFLGPLLGRAARHHGFLVPAETFGNRGQRLGGALEVHQGVEIAHFTVPRIEVSKG